MPLRSDPLDELAIPDGTTVEEHDLVTDGDVIVGGQSTVEFGVRGHNVIAGERVTFGGHIEAESDCRLDMWSEVDGEVLVGRDAYLGERVHIAGQLMVSGDLDIGDDVDIDEGFEANGWIVIRNPMPTIVFLFAYLSQLLRIGEEEAAEEVVSELLESDADADPAVIPRSAHVSDDSWRVSTPATIGDDCRLHGNIRAESIAVGARNDVFGSLRARGDITIEEDTVIHGDVTTRSGTVELADDVEIRGDVSCEDLQFHEGAVVDGTMRAGGEMTMVQAGTAHRIAADGDGGRNREDHASDAETGADAEEDADAETEAAPEEEDADASDESETASDRSDADSADAPDDDESTEANDGDAEAVEDDTHLEDDTDLEIEDIESELAGDEDEDEEDEVEIVEADADAEDDPAVEADADDADPVDPADEDAEILTDGPEDAADAADESDEAHAESFEFEGERGTVESED
ncbi:MULTISPECIES: polymer-forming cytoskeletal protein [Halorussus]|uniref:polymer-forming cytoskeletal protein n=1 Tax=Halorussus TaxID=1070314 RepID=UPI0020A09914|nr:polymer-forming cytoskeletal protein [Halorussus vallis]USZ75461.1 polymer-forming cytoskeletal protein [Halorussus vallis]